MSANRARGCSVIVEILYFSRYRTRLISEPSGRGHVRRLAARLKFLLSVTGLRISELAALRWNDVGLQSLTIDER